MGTRELDVDELSRVTDLMFECGLTFTVKSRKAERACLNMTSILICWTRVSRSQVTGVLPHTQYLVRALKTTVEKGFM